MKPSRIVRRFESLKNDRQDIESVWRQLERFIMPFRGRFYEGKESDGKPDWRRREIYDSTAVDAASSLAASIQGNLVSPSVRWFDLRYSDNNMNRDDKSREWIEEASDKLYYELQQSNFNLEIAECFMDLVGFGTAVLVEEQDENGDLEFSAVPIREAYFEIGSKSQVYNFYRKLEWTAVQIADKFAPDGNYESLPDCVQAKLETDDLDSTEKFEIVYCIYRRPEISDTDVLQPLAQDKMPYGFRYVLVNTKEELGEEGGYYEMPAFVVRWRTVAGSDWGYSPGLPVLSTIMTLNQATQATLESAEKMIEPPVMTTQRGLIGDLDLRRGGVNIVNDMADLAPFPVGGDVNAGIIIIEDLRGQIRRAFFEDQLELKESPAMTATEVNVRYELMQRLLGPTLGRMQSDLLDPLITRTMRILLRSEELSVPPEAAITGRGIDVEYMGPLPRAQKSDKAAAILGFIGTLGQFAEMVPTVLDIPDFDALLSEVAELTGVPAIGINSKKQIAQIRQKREAEMQKMRQAEQAQAEGQAMQSIGQGMDALPPEAIAALQQSVPPRERR